MNSEALSQLKRFYSNLYTELRLKKKLRSNSVVLSVLYIKSNDAYEFIRKSGILKGSIAYDIFVELKQNGYIRVSEQAEKYVITMKGVWIIETQNGTITDQILINEIDRKWFDLFQEEGFLADKEKVIILTMITIRSFSANATLNLKRNDIDLSRVETIMRSCYQFLVDNGFIKKLQIDNLFGGAGNEHPVSNIIRHTDKLLKKTKGIYKTLGQQQKYYLDVSGEDGNLMEDSLCMLLGLIFGSKMTVDVKETFKEFCTKIAYDQSPYLFNANDHRFAQPVYDSQFNEAIERYYAARYQWDDTRI